MSLLEELNESIKKLNSEIANKAQKAILEEVRKIFEKHPKLENFSWQQYTPYFNDGEACNFNVYYDYPIINGVNEDDAFDWDSQKKCLVWNDTLSGMSGDEFMAIASDIKAFLSAIDDSILLAAFGDHRQIKFLRDGSFESEEYDHE